MAQRVKGPPWPTGEPCQLELSGRRMVGIDSYPWEDPGEMAMAEGREIRLWGAKLGAEGSTHTSHRQGRRLGKRAENNGYARPDLRPTQLQFQPMVCFSPVLSPSFPSLRKSDCYDGPDQLRGGSIHRWPGILFRDSLMFARLFPEILLQQDSHPGFGETHGSSRRCSPESSGNKGTSISPSAP
jgi:hypothetical protein